MNNALSPLFRGALAAVLGCILAFPAAGADWPYWRGPEYNGTSPQTDLPADWDPDGGPDSNLLWKREELGGRCTPTVLDGRLYTILRADEGTPREGERVVCADAETGEILWENRFNVWLSDVPDTRVGWSSVVADPETGYVYALGVCAYFQCIDGKTGETIWSMPLHEQFGMLSTYGGRTNFPIISEDLVIISGIIINYGDRAKPNHRLIAFDKKTGDVVWFNGTRDLPYDTPYSAPSLATINGQRQLVMGAGDGAIWGFQPQTGKPLWHYDLSRRGIFASPLVVGNRVFASHSEENISGTTMGAVVALEVVGSGDQTSVKELWKIEKLVVGRSAPVEIDGRLYIVDDRCKMHVIDCDTGEILQERIKIGDSRQWGSLLYADGKIYVLTENGRWAIVEPTEDGAEILERGRIRKEAFNGSPICADGRLYFPGQSALYCVGKPDAEAVTTVTAESSAVAAADNPQGTHLQVVPAEMTLTPGEEVEFKARFFNEMGQEVSSDQAVEFTATGGGSFAGNVYTAPKDNRPHAVEIKATAGTVEGQTRARVIPPLPWKYDFDQLDDAPVTWIGARYRHVVRTIDGSPALVKVTTIPKGARSRGWMGPSELANYTIAVDARAQRKDDKLPDIGVIAQGYVLDLQGENQELQIRSWAPQLRMASTVDFPWQEDTWYRMKLRAEIVEEDGQQVAVLSGKVWPKNDPEPKEWTVTARDESPNLKGSPGLYGNAKDAELYLDNLEVTAND